MEKTETSIQVIDFEKKIPSTVVGLIDFTGKLNIEAIFRTLEVTRKKEYTPKSYITYDCFIKDSTLQAPMQVPITFKEGEIPHLGFAGPIWGMQHDKNRRGDYKLHKFKNSITIALSIKGKNVTVHLSNKSLHLTGIKSESMAYDSYEVIKYNIDSVENILKYMKADPSATQNTINYIKEITRGEKGYTFPNMDEFIPIKDTYFLDGINTLNPLSESFNLLLQKLDQIGEISKETKDKILFQSNNVEKGYNKFPLKVVSCFGINRNIKGELPTVVNKLIFDFLIDKMKDYNNYENYLALLDYLMSLNSLYETEISITEMKYVNINYNYSLGIKINRSNFRTFINSQPVSGYIKFTAEYKKSIDKFVTVYLPFIIPENLASRIRRSDKLEKNCHKFIVYKTGAVTQSGPHPQLNEIAYYQFISLVKKCEDSMMLSIESDESMTI